MRPLVTLRPSGSGSQAFGYPIIVWRDGKSLPSRRKRFRWKSPSRTSRFRRRGRNDRRCHYTRSFSRMPRHVATSCASAASPPSDCRYPAICRPLRQCLASKRKNRAKSVILVYLGGGLSHHDSFDLKPDAPDEIRGKYKPIATQCPRPAGRRTAAAHGPDDGQGRAGPLRRAQQRPPRDGHQLGDVGPVRLGVRRLSRPSAPWSLTRLGFTGTLPPYVAIPRNPSFTWELGKSAFLGGRYESFKTGDPNAPTSRCRMSPRRA